MHGFGRYFVSRSTVATTRLNLGSVSEILRAVARQRGLEFLVLVRDEAAQVRERLPMSLCRLEGDRSRPVQPVQCGAANMANVANLPCVRILSSPPSINN